MRRLLTSALLLAALSTGCGRHHHVVVYEATPVVLSPPYVYVPASPPGPAFDMGAARNALGNTDVGACKAAGAPRGYGHARVTFAPDGHVVRVVVDSPAGLSAEAVSCIGRELGSAVVPPFGGRDVTLGTNWLIR